MPGPITLHPGGHLFAFGLTHGLPAAALVSGGFQKTDTSASLLHLLQLGDGAVQDPFFGFEIVDNFVEVQSFATLYPAGHNQATEVAQFFHVPPFSLGPFRLRGLAVLLKRLIQLPSQL